MKSHLRANIYGLGLGSDSSLTVNFVPSEEFHYPTLELINDSNRLIPLNITSLFDNQSLFFFLNLENYIEFL